MGETRTGVLRKVKAADLLQSELDVDPDSVEALRQRLVSERRDGIDTPSDLLCRCEVCRRARRVLGRNTETGADLVPEVVEILGVERTRHATAAVDLVYGSAAHSAACRKHLLTAIGSVDPAAAAAQFDDAGYADTETVEFVVNVATGSSTFVQRAGVHVLEVLGWQLPEAIGLDAEQIAALVAGCVSTADPMSFPELRFHQSPG